MPVFKRLPTVESFCCLPLKTGCILIGIWYLLTGGTVGHNVIYADDYTSIRTIFYNIEFEYTSNKYSCFEYINKESCPQKSLSGMIFQTIVLLTDGILMCASAVLLIAIFLLNELGCSIFLYTYLFSRIFDFAVLLTFLALGMVSSCKTSGISRFSCSITCLICIIVGVYVIIVVKSFRTAIRRWNTQILQPASMCRQPRPVQHAHSHNNN